MALRSLLLTWLALMVLLALTIGATFLPIGDWRQVMNLAIAFAKAALIVWLFMKLRTEGPLVRLMAGTAAMLLLIMATMIAADYHFRPGPFARGSAPPVLPLATRTVRP